MESKFNCDICETAMDERNEGICDECYNEHFCECGQELCDSCGSPGDEFCIMCR